jgi:hypothetical protein
MKPTTLDLQVCRLQSHDTGAQRENIGLLCRNEPCMVFHPGKAFYRNSRMTQACSLYYVGSQRATQLIFVHRLHDLRDEGDFAIGILRRHAADLVHPAVAIKCLAWAECHGGGRGFFKFNVLSCWSHLFCQIFPLWSIGCLEVSIQAISVRVILNVQCRPDSCQFVLTHARTCVR